MITVNIASIPQRQKFLQHTLTSLFANERRPDLINVYLNNYDKVPLFLKHEIIKIYRSQKTGNISDKGKFFRIEKTKGYYFTCDDDIIYPRTYIQDCISGIDKYDRMACVGFHGTTFKYRYRSFYQGNDIIFFYSGLFEDTRVHMIGTGTLAFHTSTIKLKFSDFEPNMADLYLMLQSQDQQVPMIALQRKEGYLKEQVGSQIEESIWKQNRDQEHLKILNNRKLIMN